MYACGSIKTFRFLAVDRVAVSASRPVWTDGPQSAVWLPASWSRASSVSAHDPAHRIGSPAAEPHRRRQLLHTGPAVPVAELVLRRARRALDDPLFTVDQLAFGAGRRCRAPTLGPPVRRIEATANEQATKKTFSQRVETAVKDALSF